MASQEVPTASPSSSPFPSLFVEAFEMTIASIVLFAVTDLRRLARKGELLDVDQQDDEGGSRPSSVLSLPQPFRPLFGVLERNKDIVKRNIRPNEYQTIEYILDHVAEIRGEAFVQGAQLYHVGDDSASTECVHAVSANSSRQTITVTFRGSITLQDWIQDATMICGEIPNPLLGVDQEDSTSNSQPQPEMLGLHLGFRNYLYGDAPSVIPESLRKAAAPLEKVIRKSSSTEEGNDEGSKKEAKNRIEVIMDQVQALLEQNPESHLYVTGHSLGAALSLICALEAAVRFGSAERPVTCVAVANPRAGDVRFRQAIQTLERQGRLRCCVIHNRLDLVPLQPGRLCQCFCCGRTHFVQQGMQLTLDKTSFQTHYYGQNETKREQFRRQMKRLLITTMCWIRMAEQHNYREYLDRLLSNREELSKLYLDDLYKKAKL